MIGSSLCLCLSLLCGSEPIHVLHELGSGELTSRKSISLSENVQQLLLPRWSSESYAEQNARIASRPTGVVPNGVHVLTTDSVNTFSLTTPCTRWPLNNSAAVRGSVGDCGRKSKEKYL